MAYFKISLLVPSNTGETLNKNNPISYTRIPISEFYSQIDEYNEKKKANFSNQYHTYCYTYNEKVSFHSNSQKELTFSLDRYIFQQNNYIENPFSRNIHIGSQIILEDKYFNTYLFYVKNISYDIKEKNIIYNVTCEDSFSYLMIRQSSDYYIENDSSTEDFIGSKDIDWWAEKIAKDCKITYKYVSLNKIVYRTNLGNVLVLDAKTNVSNINKILKPNFSKDEYEELYETFPFSVDSSNSLNALISLGEILGLNLQTAEGFSVNRLGEESNIIEGYFWFEPTKKDYVSKLVYSPYNNIQNLSFSHAGESLTTVLNVNSVTVNDEVITMIPTIPSFFSQLILNPKEWDTSNYYSGFFKEKMRGKDILVEPFINSEWEIGETKVEGRTLILTVAEKKLNNNNFSYPSFYDKVKVNKKSYFKLQYNGETKIITPLEYNWLLYVGEENEKKFSDTIPLDEEILGTENKLKIKILFEKDLKDVAIINTDYSIVLNFFRDFSEEEESFAKIADECPWLENKILNFDYFLNQKILSEEQYNFLMNLIRNDLRIINGKLLIYTKTYYENLQKKTTYISNLTNSLDLLGASFESDIISPLQSDGTIINTDNFSDHYKNIVWNQKTKTSIINYYDTLTEYFNKYINSQQSFLKNIYNFKKYFNSKNDLSLSEIYENILVLRKSDENSNYLSFSPNTLEYVTKDFNLYNSNEESDSYGKPYVDIFDMDNKQKLSIIDKKNYNEYYIKKTGIERKQSNETNGIFAGWKVYYIKLIAVDKKHGNEWLRREIFILPKDEPFVEGNLKKMLFYKETDKKYLFRLPYPVQSDLYNLDNYNYYRYNDGNHNYDWLQLGIKIVDEEVTLNDIILDYVIYNNLKIDSEKIYIKDKGYNNIKNLLNESQITDLYTNYLTTYGALTSATNIGSDLFDVIDKEPLTIRTNNTETNISKIVNLYMDNFPVNQLYYEDNKYELIKGNYTVINNLRKTPNDYKEYLTDKFKNNIESVKYQSPDKNISTYYIDLVNSNTYSDFFRRATTTLTSTTSKVVGDIYSFIQGGLIGVGIYHIIRDSVWLNSDSDFQKEGPNNRDFFNTKFNEYHMEYYNSDTINYTNSKDNYEKYLDLEQTRKEASKEIISYKIGERRNNEFYDLENKEYSNFNPVTDAQEGKYYYRKIYNNANNYLHNFNYFDLISYNYKNIGKYWNEEGTSTNVYKELKFSTSYWRLIKQDEKINNTLTYKILPLNKKRFLFLFTQQSSNGEITYTSKVNDFLNKYLINDRLDYNIYYTLLNNAFDLNLSFAKNETLISALKKEYLNVTIKNNIWTIDKNNDSLEALIFVEEPYGLNSNFYELDKNNIITKINKNKFNMNLIYDKSEKFDYLNTTDLTKGYWYDNDYEGYELATSFDLTAKYYQYTPQGYLPVYTIFNLIPSEDFTPSITAGYFASNEYREISINEGMNNFLLPLYGHKLIYNNLNKTISIYLGRYDYKNTILSNYIGKVVKTSNTNHEIIGWVMKNFIENGENQCTLVLELIENADVTPIVNSNRIGKIIYPVEKGITTVDKISIVNKKTSFIESEEVVSLNPIECIFDNDNSIKLSKEDNNVIYKGIIEKNTQKIIDLKNLTNGDFWFNYKDSTEYPFLQEQAAIIESNLMTYWTQAYNSSKMCEYFIPEYWQTECEGSENYFSPMIYDIIKDENNIVKLKLKNKIIPDVSIYTDKQGNTSTDKYYFDFNLKNTGNSNLDINQIRKENQSIDNIFNILEVNSYECIINENGKTTYYYATNGGTTWQDLLKNVLANKNIYPNYHGWYILFFKLFKTNYKDLNFSNYTSLLEKQNNIWKIIYENFPGVILEESYTPEDATTSEDMLKLSKYYFKDLSIPERQYNITVIDKNSLLGYNGQELSIGDGILINANEYYDEYDEVKDTLKQFLYITDISYSLRNDSDMSLTVNTIKYQDKLIRKLAKLIK